MPLPPYADKNHEFGGSSAQILIVDDHEITRRAVRMLLEREAHWEICGEATDGQEAVEAAKRLQPDVIVMDFSMPRVNGIKAAEQISHEAPHTRVLLFTMHQNRELSRKTESVGIWGMVSKQNAARELVPAIDAVLHGAKYFPVTGN